MDTKSRLKNSLKLVVGNSKAENTQTINGNNNTQIASHSFNSQAIQGDNNVQISGGIHVSNAIYQIKEQAIPGPQHITEAQALQISNLVHEIVKWEKATKQTPRTYPAVWFAFKKKFKITEYKFLPQHEYQNAIKYLNQTVGRLTKSKTAQSSDEWRKTKYKAIHARTKQLDISYKLRMHLSNKFQCTSLTELDTDELASVYSWVMRQKSRR